VFEAEDPAVGGMLALSTSLDRTEGLALLDRYILDTAASAAPWEGDYFA